MAVTTSSTGAPQQHKQPSRKGKKAWRKNVDVKDVQDGLEEYREEIRSGGPLKEKSSNDIFALDTVGSKEISKKYNLQKPLKVDQILAQRSAIPAIDSHKRAGRELGDGIYEPASKRRKGDWVSKKDVQRLKKTINTTSHLQNEDGADERPVWDLWDAPPQPSPLDELEYLPKPKAKVAPATITRAPIPLTASGKHVKPVPRPAKGSSYNPDAEEYTEAVIVAGEKEVAAEKARLEAEQKDAERQARIAAIVHEETTVRTDDESAWEGFETENDDNESLRKKRPTRKTPAERNKAKRKKEAERQAKHERKMADRQKIAQDLVKILMEQGVSEENAVDAVDEELASEQSESEDDSKLRRRKLGNTVLPEKSLEVVLPDELQDSLRRLRPEGNLLQDRFRNLLVNGKIESRKPIVQARRRKVKYTEKWSFKDFGMSVGA